MLTEHKKQTIKFTIAIAVLLLILLFVAVVMMKYAIEGETNMPFELSKIIVISNVYGIDQSKENEKNWNYNICQNNDVYFYIDENQSQNNPEDLLLKSVKISNIQITKIPQKGIIQAYMPSSTSSEFYNYDKQFLISQELEYKGAVQTSYTNLEIGSKGGSALIRLVNTEIGNYVSNSEQSIANDATLLPKINATTEEIAFSVSFDFTIETTQNKYKANISLDLPTGNLAEQTNCSFEKTDMSDIIFKRVK